MILRVTAKLGKKIKSIPTETLPLDADPFADWSAHLFTAERRQYILLANTTSLYTVVMPGRGGSRVSIRSSEVCNSAWIHATKSEEMDRGDPESLC